jgi:hypothetical protein
MYLALLLPVVFCSLALLGLLVAYTGWIFFDGSAYFKRKRQEVATDSKNGIISKGRFLY